MPATRVRDGGLPRAAETSRLRRPRTGASGAEAFRRRPAERSPFSGPPSVRRASRHAPSRPATAEDDAGRSRGRPPLATNRCGRLGTAWPGGAGRWDTQDKVPGRNEQGRGGGPQKSQEGSGKGAGEEVQNPSERCPARESGAGPAARMLRDRIQPVLRDVIQQGRRPWAYSFRGCRTR